MKRLAIHIDIGESPDKTESGHGLLAIALFHHLKDRYTVTFVYDGLSPNILLPDHGSGSYKLLSDMDEGLIDLDQHLFVIDPEAPAHHVLDGLDRLSGAVLLTGIPDFWQATPKARTDLSQIHNKLAALPIDLKEGTNSVFVLDEASALFLSSLYEDFTVSLVSITPPQTSVSPVERLVLRAPHQTTAAQKAREAASILKDQGLLIDVIDVCDNTSNLVRFQKGDWIVDSSQRCSDRSAPLAQLAIQQGANAIGLATDFPPHLATDRLFLDEILDVSEWLKTLIAAANAADQSGTMLEYRPDLLVEELANQETATRNLASAANGGTQTKTASAGLEALACQLNLPLRSLGNAIGMTCTESFVGKTVPIHRIPLGLTRLPENRYLNGILCNWENNTAIRSLIGKNGLEIFIPLAPHEEISVWWEGAEGLCALSSPLLTKQLRERESASFTLSNTGVFAVRLSYWEESVDGWQRPALSEWPTGMSLIIDRLVS